MRTRADHAIRYAAFLTLAACTPATPPDDPVDVTGGGGNKAAEKNTGPTHVEGTVTVDLGSPDEAVDPATLCRLYQERVAGTADDPRKLPVPNRASAHGFSSGELRGGDACGRQDPVPHRVGPRGGAGRGDDHPHLLPHAR